MIAELQIDKPKRKCEAQRAKSVIRDPSVRRTGYQRDAEPQRTFLVLRGLQQIGPRQQRRRRSGVRAHMCAAPGSFRDDDQKKKRGQPSIRIVGQIA